jgi:2-epi-5-epi-valiolone 7-kinase
MRLPVFDLGGTWFRSALMDEAGSITDVSRLPAIGIRSLPGAPKAELVRRCLQYLVEQTARLRRSSSDVLPEAAVSLGAAMDERAGLVLSSGPLWGGHVDPFVMSDALSALDGSTHWRVFNDVSCALSAHLWIRPASKQQRTLLVTVSSGIAARLYDPITQSIPLDKKCGVQGEIGHLCVSASFGEASLRRQCECGGSHHLNAYSSGRAIEVTLRDLAFGDLVARSGFGIRTKWVSDLTSVPNDVATQFSLLSSALDAGDAAALEVLDSATRPLASVLLAILAHDPIIDTIVLTGGVVDTLGNHYVESLCRSASDIGLYGISERDPTFLSGRLVCAASDATAGLRGAGQLYLGRT